MLFWVHLITVTKRLHRWLDVILHKITNFRANGLMLWSQSEIDHVLPP